jgi:hypothetical protein
VEVLRQSQRVGSLSGSPAGTTVGPEGEGEQVTQVRCTLRSGGFERDYSGALPSISVRVEAFLILSVSVRSRARGEAVSTSSTALIGLLHLGPAGLGGLPGGVLTFFRGLILYSLFPAASALLDEIIAI